MKKILLAGAAAVGLVAGVQSAQAALSLSGGTFGNIPGSTVANEALGPLGFGTPLGGYYGAQVNTTAPGTLTFQLLGWEAGATNRFTYTGAGGGSFASTGGVGWRTPAAVTSFMRNVVAGLVPFEISTTFPVAGDLPADKVVKNGSNPNESEVPNSPVVNFFASFGQPAAGNPGNADTTGNVLYIFFDDRGSTRPNPIPGQPALPDDDNHDDLVLKISFKAAPVPEPATLGLLGAGLLGLGFAARRRRKA